MLYKWKGKFEVNVGFVLFVEVNIVGFSFNGKKWKNFIRLKNNNWFLLYNEIFFL